MKKQLIFSAYLIPDSGDSLRTPMAADMMTARGKALLEARLMFRDRPAVSEIEVVLLERNDAITSSMVQRRLA